MRIRERFRNFLNGPDHNVRVATLEAKVTELSRHIEILGAKSAFSPPLSAEEFSHLERFRMENRLLLGWQGEEREQLVQRAHATLAKLRPRKAVGFQKVRVGSAHDGGYIVLDDFDRVDTVFSFGVEHNADFDLVMADRGIQVFQFDHSIDTAPVDHPKIHWEKKMIAPQAGEGAESISHLIERYRIGESRPRSALLKMDIEHAEWAVLDSTPESDLKQFAQITAEFHGFDYFSLRKRLENMERVIDKLTKTFCVVHVHANNYSGVANFFGMTVPYVLELTFANRDVYQFEDSDETFPGALDTPNDPSRPDIRLGAFHY